MIGVLFDFYDTIVEVDDDTPQKWSLLNELGYFCSPELQSIWDPEGFNGCETPSMSDTPNYIEWRNKNIYKMAIQSGVPENKLNEIVPYIIAKERAFTVKAKKGAQELINYLKRTEIPFGICSNWDDDINVYLNQCQIHDINVVITSSDVGARKPHPKPFLRGCDALGTKPVNTIFIGDSWGNDIVGAIRCGLIPFWLTNKPLNPIPDIVHVIPALEHAIGLIDKINNNKK